MSSDGDKSFYDDVYALGDEDNLHNTAVAQALEANSEIESEEALEKVPVSVPQSAKANMVDVALNTPPKPKRVSVAITQHIPEKEHVSAAYHTITNDDFMRLQTELLNLRQQQYEGMSFALVAMILSFFHFYSGLTTGKTISGDRASKRKQQATI